MLAPGLVLDPHRVIDLEVQRCGEASGLLAARLTDAFDAARSIAAEIDGEGCIVFSVRGGEALRAGATALVRSLALEWADRRIRVNAVCGAPPPELIAFIASPAGRMLTGAVLDG